MAWTPIAVARCVLPVPGEAATWRRDSGERRDDLLRLSSAGGQDGGLDRPTRRVRRRRVSDDPFRLRPLDVDAGMDVTARGCRLRDPFGSAALRGAAA